ncbi:putative ATPase/transcriptional regulator with XRE-family HTH domain [Allocatelliglobosispora scoriae]|uniref:Putative ATPase/transcriptional regulator with XRE-family HTH domain n=1 Tax=Allocatelliglobosispora scoriae TaxID=643052 RepID=A0A841BUC0_9ACTN|nr:helix-turn-helix domain-containing protein [Allocatelliglobosispora scoriae]MBB5871048.1 putative ATPase/transcriptional regulator with XRE-family HTH domain [Allocatelliglobosispora scoriae]
MPPNTPSAQPSPSDDGFAARLRHLRAGAGLTQSDLAQRAGVGVRTVRDLEAGRAVRPQRSTVELLGSALGLRGRDLADFFASARGTRLPAAPLPTGAPVLRRLPVPVELIGRDHELGGLIEHLRRDGGLTTLVGLAGVGKTVLAWAAAHRVSAHFPGGVVGVTVTEGDTEADVIDSLGAVLGVSHPEALARRFTQPTLVLVDSVDHAPGSCEAVIARLLAASPQLRMIATGRGSLGVSGERVWPVAPLDLPPPDASTLAEAHQAPASALFLHRWAAHRGAPPDECEVKAVVELCRRLGGLPLAIELAAARGRVLDPSEMLARNVLDETAAEILRDAVTASYRLLNSRQRRVLRLLGVFRHRWSIELAEELLGAEVDAVAALDRLVELGLISVRGTGALRFMLLDVVRDYARDQAEVHGELAEALNRHAVVMARYAARAAPALAGPEMTAAIARLDDVSTDIWAAITHAATEDPQTALSIASKLPRWWRLRGRDVVGRRWLRQLLDDPRCAEADPTVRAWAMVGLGQLANEHGAGGEELSAVREAVQHFHAVGDVTGELAARTVLFALCMGGSEFDEAREHGQEVLAIATRTGRLRDMTIAQQNLTWHDLRAGDLVTAQRRLTEADRLAARSGESRLRVLIRCNLAEVLRLDGRFGEAAIVGRQALGLLVGLGDPGHHRRVLATIGQAQAQAGDHAEAEATLAELRVLVGQATAAEDGPCAVVEAAIAFARGQRALAAAWYSAAADAFAGQHDLRDVAQALVGLVASTDDPAERAAARSRLDVVLREGGLTLTPMELAAISTP